MKRQFLIIIHKDEDSDYGVTVPDLPGCFSIGKTIEEAKENAVEAIELHLEGLTEDGFQPPMKADIDKARLRVRRARKEEDGGTFHWVTVDI